jgi:hypothetical protein
MALTTGQIAPIVALIAGILIRRFKSEVQQGSIDGMAE